MESLFDAAAERVALETGRPLSQARVDVAFGAVPVSGPLFDTQLEEPAIFDEGRCSVHGTPLLLESGGGGKMSCPRCS